MEQELGFSRAVIIVWVSGAVASVLLGMLVSPIAWAMIAGSGRQIDARWGSVLVVVGINALLGAIGVTVGVGLFGYRLSYPSAVFALAVGGIAAVAVNGSSSCGRRARPAACRCQSSRRCTGR
jgi:hypothetical protein